MTGSNGTNGNGAADSGKPAPHCPVCHAEMTLTIEHRDGEDHRVWVCPRAAEHPPPPAGRWWTEPPFAAP